MSTDRKTRRLVVALRLTFAMATALSLLGIWRLMTRLPWAADAFPAAAGCMAFASFFERSDGE
jgi:hypothetical protein